MSDSLRTAARLHGRRLSGPLEDVEREWVL